MNNVSERDTLVNKRKFSSQKWISKEKTLGFLTRFHGCKLMGLKLGQMR